MLSRILRVSLVIIAFIFLSAMGGGKGGGFEKAPRVDRNFSVTVTDLSDNKIAGERFSWEGRTYFSGYFGLAQVSMPFEKVRSVNFGEKKERKVKAVVRLADGSETTFDMDADSRCFGEAGFGSFMLRMDEIKSITFK